MCFFFEYRRFDALSVPCNIKLMAVNEKEKR
jgi:hypothetical protein